MNNLCDFVGQQRWNGIADLPILFGSIAFEEIVIRKGLQPSRLAHCEASALSRIGVDVVMPILLDVRHHRR